METKTSGSPYYPYPGPPGWGEEGGDLRAEDRRGTQLKEGEEPGWTVRIDVFFKKKIITIYLHPGQGKRRGDGLVWFYLQGTQERRVGWRRWRPGGREGGQGVGGPPAPNPIHPSFSSLPTTS